MCDAVQADNFTPDYTSENPWGDLVIEDNSYDGNTYTDKAEKTTPINVTVKGSGKFALDSNILCDKTVAPGDTFENDIIIDNKTAKKVELFFSTDDIMTDDENNLLDNINLRLYFDGKEFYNGTLRAAKLNKWKEIGILEKGATHTIHYEVDVPETLNNKFQMKNQKFIWNLMMNEIHETPKTGDTTNLILWISIMAVSGIALLIVGRKRDKDEE